jgi:hypothetical protein
MLAALLAEHECWLRLMNCVSIRPIIMVTMMIGCNGLVFTLSFLVVLYGMTILFVTILHDSRPPLLHGKVSRNYLDLVASYVSRTFYTTNQRIESATLYLAASIPTNRNDRHKYRRQLPPSVRGLKPVDRDEDDYPQG